MPHTLKSTLSPQFRIAHSKVLRRSFPDFIFRGDRNDFSRLDSRVHGFLHWENSSSIIWGLCSLAAPQLDSPFIADVHFVRGTFSLSLRTRSQAYDRSSQPAAPSTAVPLASPASIFKLQPLRGLALESLPNSQPPSTPGRPSTHGTHDCSPTPMNVLAASPLSIPPSSLSDVGVQLDSSKSVACHSPPRCDVQDAGGSLLLQFPVLRKDFLVRFASNGVDAQVTDKMISDAFSEIKLAAVLISLISFQNCHFPRSDRKRLVIECSSDCAFYVLATLQLRMGGVQVVSSNIVHTCSPSATPPRLPMNYLLEIFEPVLRADCKASIRVLLERTCSVLPAAVQSVLAETPALRLYRGRAATLSLLRTDPLLALQRLPDLFRRMKIADPDFADDLHTVSGMRGQDNPESSTYMSVSVVLGPARRLFMSGFLRSLYSADAAHCDSDQKGVLMSFVGFGPNDEWIPLVSGHFPVENEANWNRFLTFTKSSLTGLDTQASHIITDQTKGLENAIHDTFPNMYHAFCAQHRSDKLPMSFRKNFFALAKASNLHVFNLMVEQFLNTHGSGPQERQAADVYLQTIVFKVSPHLWSLAHMSLNANDARAHFVACSVEQCTRSALWEAKTSRRPVQEVRSSPPPAYILDGPFANPFGHISSQIAESGNSVYKVGDSPIRSLPVGEMMLAIFKLHCERFLFLKKVYIGLADVFPKNVYEALHFRRGSMFPNACEIVDRDHLCGSVRFSPSSPDLAAVSLTDLCCTCRSWQLFGIPCSHALMLSNALAISEITPYLHQNLLVSSGKALFLAMREIFPIDTVDLVPDLSMVLPKSLAVLPGRPKGAPAEKRRLLRTGNLPILGLSY